MLLRHSRRCLERAALQRVPKLKRPGPKALRAPQHMDGVPGLSPAEQARVDASAEIHSISRTLLRAVFSTAGRAGLEQPP